MAILKQSTAYTRMFVMIDSADHVTGKTGLTVTLTLSKAGGAFAAAGGAISEVSSGWYKVALTTTDTNTLGDLAYHATSAGADPTDFVDSVSARINDDLAFPATSGRSMVVDAAGLVDANTVKLGPTGAGTAQTARDIGASVLLSAGTGTGQLDFTSGVVKSNVTQWNGQAVVTPNANGVPIVDTRQLVRQNTAQGTGNSTTAIKLDAGASATNGFYKGMLIQVISGTGAPQAGVCTAYDGTTKIATVTPAWPTAPDATSVFQIFPAMVDLESIVEAAVATGTAQLGVNAVNIGGTAQTGRDLGASVLLSAGTGAGQLDFTSGVVKANLVQILGTALTETAGQIAAAFKQFFNIAGPTSTMNLITAVTTTTTATNLTTNNDKTGYSLAANDSPVIVTGTASAGAASTITLAGASATDSLYVGQTVKLTGGTGAGQVRVITAYVGTTKVATVDRAWQTNPDATSTFAVLATDLAKTDVNLQVVAASVQGNVTGSVASVTGAVGSVTGSVGSVTGAVGSVTGNVGGNVVGSVGSVTGAVGSVTAGVTVTTNNDKTGYTASTVSDKIGYALSAAGLDSITATDPGAVATTFPAMVVQLWRRFFKKSTLTSTQLKTYADDGVTVRTTQTVADDGTTQTQGAGV